MSIYANRRTINSILIVTGLLFGLGGCASASPEHDAASTVASDDSIDRGAPVWFVDNIKFLTGKGGRWITSNKQYQSEQESWDAYGIEWSAGPAHASMTGRLFGIKDGKESSADFWQFAQFWNVETREGVIQQFGWGQIGLGTIVSDGPNGAIKMTQRFIDSAGQARTEGHKTSNPDFDSHVTTSFTIKGDKWSKQRSYKWVRQY